MVADSRNEIIGHFTSADLDMVADLIISKASDSFLDKCLEKRLLTIEAKPLVNALAKAERLGYDSNDIVQEDQRERVIPQEAYPGATAAVNGFPAGPAQPPQHTLQCMSCFRTFQYQSAYDHVSAPSKRSWASRPLTLIAAYEIQRLQSNPSYGQWLSTLLPVLRSRLREGA
jgi:hypothetical protein